MLHVLCFMLHVLCCISWKTEEHLVDWPVLNINDYHAWSLFTSCHQKLVDSYAFHSALSLILVFISITFLVLCHLDIPFRIFVSLVLSLFLLVYDFRNGYRVPYLSNFEFRLSFPYSFVYWFFISTFIRHSSHLFSPIYSNWNRNNSLLVLITVAKKGSFRHEDLGNESIVC